MERIAHLRLANDNAGLAERLSAANDSSGWRWALVVAFHSAHHYVHALFDHLAGDLPPDELIPRGNMLVRLSYVHPGSHGAGPGGTRHSIRLLTAKTPDLAGLESLFSNLMTMSHTARYGFAGSSYTEISQDDAVQAMKALASLRVVIAPHLELNGQS